MKKFTKILILVVALITMISGFAPRVFALPVITPLNVEFTPDPLFVRPNFLPLDEVSGTAIVTNNSGLTQTIGTEAINILDNDNFGSLLHLKIMEGSTILYDNSLADFFATAGEYSLGIITNGTSRTFTYTISFINSSDNSYQGKTLGFDVCVGFLGGETHCGDTVISGENGNDTGGGTIYGSSSGGGSITIPLVIFNENASNIFANGFIPESGQATITWNSNKLATSQVVYGPISSPSFPYTLDLIPPNFGYPYYTSEDFTKVINHSILLTDLTPGETYKFRVISHASPATVSPEFEFTVPIPTQTDNYVYVVNNTDSRRQGNVLGASTPNIPEEDGEVAGDFFDNSIALVSSGVAEDTWFSCYLLALLIFILMYLIWRLWLRKRYEKLGIREEEIQNRFYLFFALISLLIIIILLILVNYCSLLIFIIVFIISTCLYAYRKLRGI